MTSGLSGITYSSYNPKEAKKLLDGFNNKE